MPPLNPEIARYLLDRYPQTNSAGLQGLWLVAWRWIADNVSMEFMWGGTIPQAFESAAVLRVQALCTTDDPHLQQALYFAASELLAPWQ